MSIFKSYFKIAWRNLRRHQLYSFINISGLSIALAAFWMIALYVANELSYDNYHLNADRIFRVAQHANWDGGNLNLACTPAPFAPALKSSYPEIRETVRIESAGEEIITYDNRQLKVNDIFFTENTVFKIFSYQFIYGDANTALSFPNAMVVTKTLAEKIFGHAALALNKTVYFNNKGTLITGVINDIPVNSHFYFSGLRSLQGNFADGWERSYLYTYLLLKEDINPKKLETTYSLFLNQHLKGLVDNVSFQVELQPIQSIHLHSNLDYEIGSTGNILHVYIFSLVALLILVIASINYINLSTARSSRRIKEIGIRKVSGSGRSALSCMFLTESVLLLFIAAIVAMLILYSTLPWFQTVTGTAFRNITFQKSLVIFQFVVTIILIAGSFIVYQQMQYVMKKDLGFNKSQVLSFHLENVLMRQKMNALKDKLMQNHLIENIASASNPIGSNNIGGRDYNIEVNGKIEPKTRMAKQLMIDENFISTLEIKLIRGRNFLKDMPTDKDQALIVNEAFAKDAGWKEPIGKKVQCGTDSLGKPLIYIITGVVRDFNIYSLQHTIEPLIMQLPKALNDRDIMYVRIGNKQIPKTINFIEATYRDFDRMHPLDYQFIDQRFASQYKAEQKQENVLLVLTILAISISCFGLFGLVTSIADDRVKEIGIRKILGASIGSIVTLLSVDFLKLILIALIIAIPIAWWAMSNWLQNFAYRVDIIWKIFALSGVCSLLIALLTVCLRAIKTAIVNPVKNLRSE